MIMTPTREQFKELMTFIKNAQEKEDKVNDALRIIWDDEQEQYPPFYISPWWIAIRYAFCLLFNLEFNRLGIDQKERRNTGLTRRNTTLVTSMHFTTTL